MNFNSCHFRRYIALFPANVLHFEYVTNIFLDFVH